MQTHEQKQHIPFVHILKRDTVPFYESVLIRLGAGVCAFLIMMLLSKLILGDLTEDSLPAILKTFWDGAFGTFRRRFSLLYDTAILLAIALALAPAFRMRFWNIGAEGQVLIGGLAAVLCMKLIADRIPNWLLLLIMFFAALLAGAIWALIPAIFKAIWGTNETLFTLMMNYIATCLVAFSIQALYPKGTGTMGIVNADTRAGWLPKILQSAGSKASVFEKILASEYFLSVVFIGILTVLLFIYLNYSKQGYEISVVGQSENTARYIGINVKKVILRTMTISGAICGFTGFLIVSGYNHSIATDAVGGRGFTAIMVCWLAKFNPFFMFLAAFLIVFIEKGSGQIANTYNIDASYADILSGITLFLLIGCEFFIQYKMQFRKLRKEKI